MTRVTILGSGGSVGVPAIGGIWGKCDPTEPRNRRRRPSILVEHDDKVFLIETSPDCREQLLSANVTHLDAILLTHDHADHLHGIDDVRVLAGRMGRKIPFYADPVALNTALTRFGYIFQGDEREGELYRPFLEAHKLKDGVQTIENTQICVFAQNHGVCRSSGFRFGDVAFSTDFITLSEEAFAALTGVKLWLVAALHHDPGHPTHACFDAVMAMIKRVNPERAVLTNLGLSMDYKSLCDILPENIRPGYDGMVIDV